MKQASDFEPDVVIVGSGATGSMAAYVLTAAGVRVLLLEAGRHYDPVAETPMFNTAREAPLLGGGTADKPFGYYDATIDGGWQVPGEPYTTAEGTNFSWWRTRMLGGRTNHWGRYVPRFGPYDFKPYSRDGLGVDWPITYEELAPFYDRTELVVGVSGGYSGIENDPASSPGVLQPAAAFRVPELLLKAAAGNLGIPVVPMRRAVITRDMPHPDAPRSACYNATPCGRGCSIGAAFQTPTSLLPMAMGTGNLRIITNAMVHSVLTNAEGRATGVAYFDKTDGSEHAVEARVVVLAPSACESARILLNSANAQFPDGLANSSGQVGKNLMDSVGAGVWGQIPALENRPRYNEDGLSSSHAYIPWWGHRDQASGKLDFPRGYHFEPGGRFDAPGGAPGIPGGADGYGPKLKEEARRYYGSFFGLSLRGEMIPNADSYCELDPEVKDKFGLPVLRFHWKWSEHEIRQVAHGLKAGREIIERMGGIVLSEDLPAEEAIMDGGVIIHEVGTTRMGDDPATSVTNSYGQTWDVDNLWIVDGGILASNAHKNCTLTMMALAMRGCEQLAGQLGRGEL